MPEFEFVQPPAQQPERRYFMVTWLRAEYVFYESTVNAGTYAGKIDAVPVYVDWSRQPKYAVYLRGIQQVTQSGKSWDTAGLKHVIRSMMADYVGLSGIERFRNQLPYECTSFETDFTLLHKDIYICRFDDGSGWFYSTGDDPHDWDTVESCAFTHTETPSVAHCIEAFSSGTMTIRETDDYIEEYRDDDDE